MAVKDSYRICIIISNIKRKERSLNIMKMNKLNILKNSLKNTLPVIAGTATCVLTNTSIALAGTGVAKVDNGLNVVKTLSIGVCAVIGVVGLVKGGMTFSSGLSQRDQSGIVTGGLELAGGFIMAAISAVITAMGF